MLFLITGALLIVDVLGCRTQIYIIYNIYVDKWMWSCYPALPLLFFLNFPTPSNTFLRRYTSQGELVDRVEYHITQTGDHVHKGRVELRQAEQYQTKARKVRFYLPVF